MAEDIPTITSDSSNPAVQVLLDERELRQIYSNSYRIHATNDEVIIDLGFNMPNPNPQTGQQQLLLEDHRSRRHVLHERQAPLPIARPTHQTLRTAIRRTRPPGQRPADRIFLFRNSLNAHGLR